ncbi:hypothetical protein EL84_25910 [Paenibacillus sp. VT-400]|uniref:hypothetical protein n=1 Tax=Paenibacillus sp. VT-400 TaxID=1495853 RepID=UPI00064A5EBF|nr:hypothetical protein [Paenibacillus sp. VT-400]KLU55481.1 hypothetical protein EL84_25910 [Paenibacillus sp. VT-400]
MIAESAAADLVLNSPYVTDHLIQHGLIDRGQHTAFAPVFTANLRAQMYGTEEGRGHKLTTVTANKRAEAVTVHTLRNFPRVAAKVKARRKSDNELFLGNREAALVESLQCDYIAGTKLSAQAETAAGIALLRRFSNELPKFRHFLHLMNVDVRDAIGLREFATEGKVRNI